MEKRRADVGFGSVLLTQFTGNDCMRTFKKVQVKSGASVTIPCLYDQKYKNNVKYWCKGNQQEPCSPMVSTDSPQRKDGVSITDVPDLLLINVTMRNLREKDAGTYWCAVKIDGDSNESTHLNLTVTPG
ncbi:polymeric immunoglobulin receptor-like [Scleropages formosus]|nr:polymeric immunoglobulin receptor-like [Scleropages formosus]